MDPEHLLAYVIRPTLAYLGDRYAAPAAAQLVLGTAIVESRLRWLTQLGGGPARGLWQMESASVADHIEWCDRHPELGRPALSLLVGPLPPFAQLAGNLYFAAGMCRVHYWRVREPLPEFGDIQAQARYWKRWYNTLSGKGKAEEFEQAWRFAMDARELD